MPVTHARQVVLAATLVALVGLPWAATPASAATASCEYTGSNHKLKITISGTGVKTLSRARNGNIFVDAAWCGRATVTNTDRIIVLAGASSQFLNIDLNNGGFKPGFTNEPGSSDEIEISISLGGNSDDVYITGTDNSDNIVVGKSSGYFVLGRINFNAAEATGVDADVTLILGIENVTVFGHGGADTISGGGGAGTGDTFALFMRIEGGNGPDDLTGSSVHDTIYGDAGLDVLYGLAGADELDATDGAGGDQIFGGKGVDNCLADPGDTVTNC